MLIRAVLLLLVLCPSAAAIAAPAALVSLPLPSVGTVNGEPVFQPEFDEAMRTLQCLNLPLAEWQRQAWQICFRNACLEQLAEAHGVLHAVGLIARRQAFDQENRARATFAAQGGRVYGPVQFRWEQFERIWWDRLNQSVSRAINAGFQPATEDEQHRYYAAHPERFTASGEDKPRPFAEVRGLTRVALSQSRYEAAVSQAMTTARCVVTFPATVPAPSGH